MEQELFIPQPPKPLSELNETFSHRQMELPDQLLVGAIDSHVHAGPVLGSNPGHLDPIQAAIDARDAGMRSLVYYDVFGWASGTAWMVNRHVPGITTFGGYLMNSCHGGMNPRAVRTALNLEGGCRFISFGSHCTYYSASREATLIDGKPVPLKDAYPKFRQEELSRAVCIPLEDPIPPQLDEILSMVAEKPEVYLNTGHVSPQEAVRIVELAKRYGIKKVLIAHPARRAMTIQQQKWAASQGAFLEGYAGDLFFPDTPHTHYYVEPEYMDRTCELDYYTQVETFTHWMRVIREVGPEHFVLATDYGIRSSPTPAQGMRLLISMLLDYEFTPEQIRQMTALNPACLIGLPDAQ